MTGYSSKKKAASAKTIDKVNWADHEPDGLAQPAQEPVACKHEWFRTGAMEPRECRCIKCGAWNTTPPQRKPLTDEQMREVLRTCQSDAVELLRNRWLYVKEFARAIEAAHGIKENT